MTTQSTEPICIQRAVPVSDGGAGTVEGGIEVVFTGLATVKILKPSRSLEANQTVMKQGYLFGIWNSGAYAPQASDTIVFRGQSLTLQTWAWEDNSRRRFALTVIQQ